MIRTNRAVARLPFLALLLSSGCSSSSNATSAAADGGAADSSPAPRTAGVIALNQGDVHFDVAVPGVSLGTVRGDRNTGAHDTFVKMTAGSSVPSHWYTADIRGVVVAGSVTHLTPTNQMSPTTLTSGSFFFIPAMAEHTSRCDGSQDCLFLIYQEVAFGLTVNPGMVPTTPAPVNPSAKFVLPNTAKPTELIPGVASIASVDGDWMNRANGSFVTITRGQKRRAALLHARRYGRRRRRQSRKPHAQ